MFFRKKKENICNADKGIHECGSISKLRECQTKIKELNNFNLDNIMDKYLEKDSYLAHSIKYDLERLMYILILDNKVESFLKDLSIYSDNKSILNKLYEEVKNEKKLLGIE